MSVPVIDRRLPAIDYSLFRWVRTMEYTVGAVTGTLAVHHAPLDVIPAYPSDLTQLKRSTLSVCVPPALAAGGQEFFGGDLSVDVLGCEIYGFIVSNAEERQMRFYQSRLLNDLEQLLVTFGGDEGFEVFDADAPHDPIGYADTDNVRARLLPQNAPGLIPLRAAFVIEFTVDLV